MSDTLCTTCGAAMPVLFNVTRYCPNDCDRICDLPPPGWRCKLPRGHSGPCPALPNGPISGPYGRARFYQSWLWQPAGMGARVLSCPYCLLDGRQTSLVCGDEENKQFTAICNDPACHTLVVENDENH